MEPARGAERTTSSAPSARPVFLAWRGYALGLMVVALSASVGWIGRRALPSSDIAVLHMLGVMVVAMRWGGGPTLLTATVAALSYDFFFVPPLLHFALGDERHLLTFAMMFGVGISTSALTSRIKRHEQEARVRDEQSAALYGLSRALGATADEHEVTTLVAHQAARVLQVHAFVLNVTSSEASAERTLRVVSQTGEPSLSLDELELVRASLADVSQACVITPAATRTLCSLKLMVGPSVLGAMVLAAPAARVAALDLEFAEAFARQGAQALARARSTADARIAAIRAQTEEMRSSLLSAVSHDLRTPLAAITGAATTLRDDPTSISPDERADLAATICEEADRLARLVTNLLDMTRVDSGALQVKRTWTSIDEVLASALDRCPAGLSARVTVHLPEALCLIFVDPLLLGQVFLNLLDNAAKYTPPGTLFEIQARVEPEQIAIDVIDYGVGIAPDMVEKVFEKFVRGGAQSELSGAGLGLAICRGIVKAHGGSLVADRHQAGGAVFKIRLPLDVNAPPLPTSSEVIEHDA